MISATSNTRTSASEVLHQFIERIGQCAADLRRQMRVDLRRARTAMAQAVLDEPQVDAGFQKMSRVRMPQGMHMRGLGHAGSL